MGKNSKPRVYRGWGDWILVRRDGTTRCYHRSWRNAIDCLIRSDAR